MKKATFFLLLLTFSMPLLAQKKNKGKNRKEPVQTEYISVGDTAPVADSATKFTGLIKYRITTDDPADRDSMFIIFGENQIRVTLFNAGMKENEIFETTMIANFRDSTLRVLDKRKMIYKTEKLGARNAETVFELANHKKTAPILNFTCQEYSGSMKTRDGDEFEAAALISKQHSFLGTVDYNFLNIQPVVLGYRIVLGFRTKSSENENTYIIAYKIEPGQVDSYFDLSGYQAK